MIAIDMEMPAGCADCKMLDGFIEYTVRGVNSFKQRLLAVCILRKDYYKGTGSGHPIKSRCERPDWCPLHEVKFIEEVEPKGAKTA